jgi:hypothetical protein
MAGGDQEGLKLAHRHFGLADGEIPGQAHCPGRQFLRPRVLIIGTRPQCEPARRNNNDWRAVFAVLDDVATFFGGTLASGCKGD